MKYAVSGLSYEQDLNSIYYQIDSHPKNMKPVFDDSYDVKFWVDNFISSCPEKTMKDYGWMTESEPIVSQLYKYFYLNMPDILDSLTAIFTHKRKLLTVDERFKWVPASSCWIAKPRIHQKRKLISMISSSKLLCAGHAKRLQYAEKFYRDVDLYGRGFNPIENKEQGLADYMFSIAIENDECSGYFTEKILDCFATGTIPVYLGDPDIGIEFNMDGIILLDDNFSVSDLSVDLYNSKIDAVIDNFNRSMNFFTVEDYIYNNYLATR